MGAGEGRVRRAAAGRGERREGVEEGCDTVCMQVVGRERPSSKELTDWKMLNGKSSAEQYNPETCFLLRTRKI